jgi:putative phosphoesterase
MRIAFISDIHGNFHALELALADIAKAKVDQIICLGDVASLGPQPHEVVTRLLELQIPCIQGNHESYLLNPKLTEDHLPWLRETELWCLTQLTPSDMDFLRSFQPNIRLNVDDKTSLLCYHGSPRSNEEWIYPTISTESLDEIFDGQSATVLIGGHTHVQMTRQHKGRLIINPGSVGMPFEFPSPGEKMHMLRWAEYAIVDHTDRKLTVTLHRLPIDFDQLTKVARASGIPDVEYWLSTWWE